MSPMNDEALLRYSRHILLNDIDVSGQEKLAASRVMIVGAGGLGCPAAMYLAASGVGQLIIADDDVVDITNLQRQIGHSTDDIGLPKVVSLVGKLKEINPDIVITGLHERLAADRLNDVLSASDAVLDCSDNVATRLMVNAAAVFHKIPLVSGAAIRFEGQVSVFNYTPESPCYACLYGMEADEEEMTCSQRGVFSPLVGVVGSMMAAEALKLLIGLGSILDGRLLLCDIRQMDWRSLILRKDPLCPVCSGRG